VTQVVVLFSLDKGKVFELAQGLSKKTLSNNYLIYQKLLTL